jgi:hypothetical protein
VTPTTLDRAVVSDALAPRRDGEALCQDPKRYRSVVSMLLHVGKTARPDVLYAAALLSLHTQAPVARHWAVAEAVLGYLGGSAHQAVTLGRAPVGGPTGGDVVSVSSYLDAVRAPDGRVRVAYITLLDSAPVCWGSTLAKHKAKNDFEAVLLAADAALQSMQIVRNIVAETMTEGDTSCMDMALHTDDPFLEGIVSRSTPTPYSGNKHIDVVGHLLRDELEKGRLRYTMVAAKKNLARMLGRALDTEDYVLAKAIVVQ